MLKTANDQRDKQLEHDDKDDPNANFYATLEFLDELPEDKVESEFVKAVKGVFQDDWRTHPTTTNKLNNRDRTIHKGELYNDGALKRKIHKEIVISLENDFCKSFDIKLDQLNNKFPIVLSFRGSIKIPFCSLSNGNSSCTCLGILTKIYGARHV